MSVVASHHQDTGASAGRKEERYSPERTVRRQKWVATLRAMVLVAPLFAFILMLFGYPLARMVWYSVASPEIESAMPELYGFLDGWDGDGTPPDAAYLTTVQALRTADEDRTLFSVAARLNNEVHGYSSLIMRTAAQLRDIEAPLTPVTARQTLLRLDPRWGQPETWQLFDRAAKPYTPHYILNALDLKRNSKGEIVRQDPHHRVFLNILGRTFWMSTVVTLLCLAVGLPIAHLIANASARWRDPLLIIVLLPFWTALLVRVYAWISLLQKEGVINSALVSFGLIDKPLQMVFDRTGVYIAMVHVLLPLMVLPLYSIMRGVSPGYMRAAASLGATPMRAFLTAYLPQVAPGIGAGCTLVFMSSIGYYVTPALVGSPQDQMIGYFIAFYTNESANWGLASALAFVLMTITGLLYLLHQRFSRTGLSLGQS